MPDHKIGHQTINVQTHVNKNEMYSSQANLIFTCYDQTTVDYDVFLKVSCCETFTNQLVE